MSNTTEMDNDTQFELAACELLQEARRERDEAQKELSSIHRWIDKNHADGFIDSLTYLQNLERVTDSWYDRIDAIEIETRRFVRERDDARESLKHITEYGTEEINAAVDLRQKLASALVERDEVRNELLEQARLLGMSSEREAKLISERDEARKKYDNLATEHMLAVNKLCNERDEAKSISDELAIIASLCLGWHDHESNDTAIKIAAALKRWKKSKVSNEQD